jgi:tmRNA-binding protein
VYNDTNGLIKVDLALAKKKKKFDKRLKIKTRENKKRIEKAKKGNVWG